MAYNGKLEMERNEGAVRGTIVVAVVVVVACRKEATKTNVPLFTEGKRKRERKKGTKERWPELEEQRNFERIDYTRSVSKLGIVGIPMCKGGGGGGKTSVSKKRDVVQAFETRRRPRQ